MYIVPDLVAPYTVSVLDMFFLHSIRILSVFEMHTIHILFVYLSNNQVAGKKMQAVKPCIRTLAPRLLWFQDLESRFLIPEPCPAIRGALGGQSRRPFWAHRGALLWGPSVALNKPQK